MRDEIKQERSVILGIAPETVKTFDSRYSRRAQGCPKCCLFNKTKRAGIYLTALNANKMQRCALRPMYQVLSFVRAGLSCTCRVTQPRNLDVSLVSAPTDMTDGCTGPFRQPARCPSGKLLNVTPMQADIRTISLHAVAVLNHGALLPRKRLRPPELAVGVSTSTNSKPSLLWRAFSLDCALQRSCRNYVAWFGVRRYENTIAGGAGRRD